MVLKKELLLLSKRSRRERFVSLAESRVNKTLHHIKLIGNLSDPSNYDYSQEQADKIIAALDTAIEDVRARFDRGGELEPGFSLDDEKTASPEAV